MHLFGFFVCRQKPDDTFLGVLNRPGDGDLHAIRRPSHAASTSRWQRNHLSAARGRINNLDGDRPTSSRLWQQHGHPVSIGSPVVVRNTSGPGREETVRTQQRQLPQIFHLDQICERTV